MPEGTRKVVDIFTDGACSGNPGPGGWAAILRFGVHEKEISGSMPKTTNNRMEVFALISALGLLKMPCDVNVYSDSAYLVNAFNERWIDHWQKNGWKTKDGKQVENQDYWKLLLLVIKKKDLRLRFFKVKGHVFKNQSGPGRRGAFFSGLERRGGKLILSGQPVFTGKRVFLSEGRFFPKETERGGYSINYSQKKTFTNK